MKDAAVLQWNPEKNEMKNSHFIVFISFADAFILRIVFLLDTQLDLKLVAEQQITSFVTVQWNYDILLVCRWTDE